MEMHVFGILVALHRIKNVLVTCFGGALCGVAWHKSQHVVALCSYEEGAPILVLEADRDKVVVGQQDMADALPEQSSDNEGRQD